MIKRICLLALPLVILSCGQQAGKKAMSEYEAGVYSETLNEVKSLEGRLADVSSYSMKGVESFQSEVNRLRYLN